MTGLQKENGSGAFGYLLLVALVPGHLLNWGVEWTFAFGVALVGMFVFPTFRARWGKAADRAALILLLLMCISMGAYVRTVAGARFFSGARDLVDLSKPVLVFFSCVLGLSLGPPTAAEARRACAVVLSFSIICFVILKFQLPFLSNLVDLIYGSTKTNISEFIIRVSIPFENPNYLGLFSVLSLCLSLAGGFRRPVLTILALAGVVISGSRTAWMTTIVLMLLFALDSALSRSAGNARSNRNALIFLGALLVGVAYFASDVMSSYQRVADLFNLVAEGDLSLDASYADRIALRATATQLILEKPVFGWGAIKYSPLEVVDNQYFGLTLRFGMLGVAVLACAMLMLIGTRLMGIEGGMNRLRAASPVGVLALWMWNGSFFENIRVATLSVLLVYCIWRVYDEPGSQCHRDRQERTEGAAEAT